MLTFNKVRFALGKVTKADDPIYLRMVLKNKLWLPCMYCLPTIIEYAKYQFIDVDAVQNLTYDMCSKNVKSVCISYEGFFSRCEVYLTPFTDGHTCHFNSRTLVSESSKHGNKTYYTKHMFR